jgi:hypothetical protein
MVNNEVEQVNFVCKITDKYVTMHFYFTNVRLFKLISYVFMYNVKMKEKVYSLLFINFMRLCGVKWNGGMCTICDSKWLLFYVTILVFTPWDWENKKIDESNFLTNTPCWVLLDMNHSNPTPSTSDIHSNKSDIRETGPRKVW